MRADDKARFSMLLADVLAGYGKPLPEAREVAVWFNQLAAFTPAAIERAFAAYRIERPDFPPTPNGIAARCKLMDGRPDENEAWAVALGSRDERETVVWTNEMAQAFALALPMLNGGDEIGARMAFKDAYARMVNEARAANRAAQWSVSAGWDAERREIAVQKAATAGLLEAPQARAMIGYEGDSQPARPEGLQRVLEALAQLENPADKAERIREQRMAEEDAADRAQREEIDRKTKEYFKQHPEARYVGLVKNRGT